MNRQDVELLYAYNSWANARILGAASAVSAEQFLASASFPHGGLRSTLTHILFAEWVWRRRWEGSSPDYRITAEEFPTFESFRVRWVSEESLLMEFVGGLTDEKLSGSIQYTSTEGQPFQRILWQTLAHLVNHGTQHRSEAAALLTDMGHSPGDIDLSLFLSEQIY